MIVTAHLGYRRHVREGAAQPSSFRMPGSPVTNRIVLAFLGIVVVLLAVNEQQRVAIYAGAVWALVIGLASIRYVRRGRAS